MLKPESFQHHIEGFNRHDRETVVRHIPNARAWEFLSANIPLFECPDPEMESTYYFRWWSYRKHITETPDGFIITEFHPDVPWAGKHNSISCAAGHHLYEGRWLHDPRFLDDYSLFWFRKGGEPRRYSFWAADAIYHRALATGDWTLPLDLLDDLAANYQAWERERQDANGLFWQIDDRDGMEVSIGGSGYRATINSYQYGDALAIARIAGMAGRPELAGAYRAKAARLKELVQARLWDDEAQFFKVLPREGEGALADVRELHGYTPWYFGLPDPRHDVAWEQLMDPQGFYAPFGPTTAERRHPRFLFEHGHHCLWNGPSWPYATTVTLAALVNLLNGPAQPCIGKEQYLDLLRIYARSHRLTLPDGTVVPWIDENLHPDTGEWIARGLLHRAGRPDWERGKEYNHSAFCDLVITGLVGLRPRADGLVEVNPLVPEQTWGYFCLDNLLYHGQRLTVLWDADGRRYGRGVGLRVLADGKEIAGAPALRRVTGRVPQ